VFETAVDNWNDRLTLAKYIFQLRRRQDVDKQNFNQAPLALKT